MHRDRYAYDRTGLKWPLNESEIGILSRSAAQSWKRNARNGARASNLFGRSGFSAGHNGRVPLFALAANQNTRRVPAILDVCRIREAIWRSSSNAQIPWIRYISPHLLWKHCAYLKAFGWICTAARRMYIRCRCCCYWCGFVSVSLHRDVPEKCTRKQ